PRRGRERLEDRYTVGDALLIERFDPIDGASCLRRVTGRHQRRRVAPSAAGWRWPAPDAGNLNGWCSPYVRLLQHHSAGPKRNRRIHLRANATCAPNPTAQTAASDA